MSPNQLNAYMFYVAVTVVQPGLSRVKAQARHLQLLGAEDVYVAEVAYGAFDVWCSA